MVTTSIVLHSRPNKEGKYPLAIRITKDRKSSYIFLGQAIEKSQWDKQSRKVKKNHPNSTRLNAFLLKKQAEVNRTHLSQELEDKDASASDIHNAVLSKKLKDSFFTEAEKYLHNLKTEGSYMRYTTDVGRIKRFKLFLKGRDIAFKDITVSLLRQFKAYIKAHYNASERTAVNYMITIRTIYNLGIKSGIVEQKYYPFGKDKMPIRFPDSVKLGLSREELELIINADLTDHPKMAHARNVWLVSFYFAGMRISDVLKLRWSDFKEGRLHYTMGKNRKTGSLKVPQQALEILEKYRQFQEKPNDLIFTELRVVEDFSDRYTVQRKTSYATKNLNKYLKRLGKKLEIDKKLTMHIARHTFGSLSGDRIPIQMLQKLYRHSDITTTINYQKSFIYKDADDALDAVINGGGED